MRKDIKKATPKFSFVYLLFFLSSLIMLIVAVVFSFFVKNIEQERIDILQNHLLVAAQRASTYLTVEELELFHTAEDMEKPEWEEIRAKLQQFAEETSVLYVYYWRYDGGDHIQYIIDNDEDEEYMVHPELFFDLDSDEITAEAVFKIEAGESWVTELGVYTESWDGLLTAVVPVFNQDGTVYCGAGVDISDEAFISMRNSIRIMEFVLFCLLFISFLTGFFGIRSYNKKAIQSANDSLSKSRFLSNMSHEMRTPMNAIIGMTTIGKKAESIEEKNRALNKIGDASSHLLGVINDVLDMAKIEADKLELAPVEYNFERAIQKVLAVVNFRVEEKEQRLIVNIDKNIPRFLLGDEQRLVQIITNLMSNAVKFTPEGGEINLNASLVCEEENDNCELCIEVADSGIGISDEQKARLFQAFEQAEAGTSRQYGGTGLGLAISKRIIELMGGIIKVESELGKGAKFIFTVKVKRSDKCSAPMSDTDDIRGEETVTNGMFGDKNLLVAEDVEINREILLVLLEDTGLNIDCAENGAEALKMVEAAPDKYDVVFMDVQMPFMNGHEATRRIRALPNLRTKAKLPIIAMTANVFKSDIEDCLAAGMDDHLGKPLDIDRVMEKLHEYLIKQ